MYINNLIRPLVFYELSKLVHIVLGELLLCRPGCQLLRDYTMENTSRHQIHSFCCENCATCNGHGIGPDQRPCSACGGKGSILVLQPTTNCPRCHGTGKPDRDYLWSVDHCVVCLGTGWIWTEFHLDESSIRGAARADKHAFS